MIFQQPKGGENNVAIIYTKIFAKKKEGHSFFHLQPFLRQLDELYAVDDVMMSCHYTPFLKSARGGE